MQYYVDATSGSDSNDGTSPDTAWQTIAKVNVQVFQPGDEILFRAGDVYSERLIVRETGTAEQPITYGAYGDGPAPLFNGTVDLSGATWTETSPGSHVWTTTQPAGPPPLDLFLNNVTQTLVPPGQPVTAPGEWSNAGGLVTVWSDVNPASGSVQALNQTAMLFIENSEHIVVRDLHFTGSWDGVLVRHAGEILLLNLEADHNHKGLKIDGGAHHVTVSGGEYHDNGPREGGTPGHGILFDPGAYDNVIENVKLYGNSEDGVAFHSGANTNNVLRNSEVYDNFNPFCDLEYAGDFFNVIVRGNAQDDLFTLKSGIIVADGGAGNDVIVADPTALPGLQVMDGGDGFDELRLVKGGYFDLTQIASFQRIETVTLVGASQITLRDDVGVALTGSLRADIVELGLAVDTLSLGFGDDEIHATVATINAGEWIDGGNGSDALVLLGGGIFNLSAFAALVSVERIVLDDSDSVLMMAPHSITKVQGGAGANTIYGIDAIDRLFGGGGNDFLSGAGDNDRLNGEDGDDTLDGGAGDDELRGGLGNDKLIGGPGIDVATYTEADYDIVASLITNTAVGGGFTDTFAGIENIDGGFGNDLIIAGKGPNVLNGRAGNDTLEGGKGNDILYAGSADDTTAQNVLNGGKGDDQLFGGPGSDQLLGDAGNDTLVGGLGDDVLSGGAGIDVASYFDSIDDIRVDLSITKAQDTGGAGWDRFRKVENVIGGSGHDQLTGNGERNVLEGAGGNDTLSGGGGNDDLIGGPGQDLLIGGPGFDRFIFRQPGDSAVDDMRDVIADFSSLQLDLIDLAEIDAFSGTPDVDDAFTFIGSAPFASGVTFGQVRFEGGVVYGDVDGDGLADFTIGVEGVASMAESDFVL